MLKNWVATDRSAIHDFQAAVKKRAWLLIVDVECNMAFM